MADATLGPMSIGRTVRRLLGKHEQRVADLYRDSFLDTTALAEAVAGFGQFPRVLEVGCGDGFVTTKLVEHMPSAHVVGIDVAATPGRHFTGDPARVEFRSCTVEAYAATDPEPFDLVLIVDVLHHVDDDTLPSLVTTAASLMRPGGHLIVKEWERNRTVGYGLGWFSDRVISGEQVRFFDRDGLVHEIERWAPALERVGDARVRPRHSNLIVAWQRPLAGSALTDTEQTVTEQTVTEHTDTDITGHEPANHGSTR